MRITVVEDNESVAKGIAYVLRDGGHAVDLIHDGTQAADFLKNDGADVIVMDINLPGQSGIDILKAMRQRDDTRPVILLTARSETSERVKGLDAGADDYLIKPFEMAELEARIRAVARRKSTPTANIKEIGPLVWDVSARTLSAYGQTLDVPRREVALFEALVRHPGQTVSKSSLLDQLYGTGSDVEESVVEVYVSRLRKRLKPHGLVITVQRGLGYALDATPK